MFRSIIHTLFPQKCVENARWSRGSLICSCGEILALRYIFDGAVRVFIYPPFRKYEKQILNISPMSGSEVIGTVCFDDFSAFMQDLKFTPMDTHPSEDEINENIQEDTYIG